MPQITVPAELLAQTMEFVQHASVFAKTALDKSGAHDLAVKKAAALVNPLVDFMIANNLAPATQKQAYTIMLSGHDTALQMCKAACDKLAAANKEIAALKGGTVKTAHDLGAAAGASSAPSAPATGDYNSLNSPFVGSRAGAGELRESDKPLLALIGR
jgi:hypothetical protein